MTKTTDSVTNWANNDGAYFSRPINKPIKQIPLGIYQLKEYGNSKECGLELISKSFEFNFKVYDLDDSFVDHCVKSYECTSDNLGILLNGIRGTGKSITAKKICNQIGIPVVIITDILENMMEFISSFPQGVLFFIDEFEKIFLDSHEHNKIAQLLSIMDGAMDGSSRKVFLLTTNNLYVNESLLQRPGRIRYLKTFDNLSPAIVFDIVDNKLKHTEHKSDLIRVISQLDIITIDIVNSLVEEVNIHNINPDKFLSFFNVQKEKKSLDVYLVNKRKDKGESVTIFRTKANINELPLDQPDNCINRSFEINNRYIGDITNIRANGDIEVENNNITKVYRIEKSQCYKEGYEHIC